MLRKSLVYPCGLSSAVTLMIPNYGILNYTIKNLLKQRKMFMQNVNDPWSTCRISSRVCEAGQLSLCLPNPSLWAGSLRQLKRTALGNPGWLNPTAVAAAAERYAVNPTYPLTRAVCFDTHETKAIWLATAANNTPTEGRFLRCIPSNFTHAAWPSVQLGIGQGGERGLFDVILCAFELATECKESQSCKRNSCTSLIDSSRIFSNQMPIYQ